MMRKPQLLIAALALATGLVIWMYFSTKNPSPTEDPNPVTSGMKDVNNNNELPKEILSAEDEWKLRRWNETFQTPIDFWGLVVDQEGHRVQGVDVRMRARDASILSGSGSKYVRTTDRNGAFSITGIRGASLYVKISKKGYENLYVPTKDQNKVFSEGEFDFDSPNIYTKTLPTKDRPAVFTLRKKLVAEVLDQMDGKRYVFRNDGTPLRVDLATAAEGAESGAVLEIRCWSTPEKPYGEGRNAPFDWRFEISSPDGGLQVWDAPNQVLAPEEGYVETYSVDMPGTLAERGPNIWRKSQNKKFWFRHGDGTYSRVKIEISTGRRHLVYIYSWHNPSGSRNLEHDPEKTNDR